MGNYGVVGYEQITIYDIDIVIEKSDPKAFKQKRSYWSVCSGDKNDGLSILELDPTKDFVSRDNLIKYIKKQLKAFSKKITKEINNEKSNK